jgi:hypothetical protein
MMPAARGSSSKYHGGAVSRPSPRNGVGIGDETEPLLRAIAAFGLTDTPALFPEPLPDDRFETLLSACARHRILGLLGAVAESGALPLAPEQRRELDRLLQAWLGHDLRLERLVLEAHEALSEAGIDHRVLKGVALAHLAYPDPSWRVFGDADLLIAASGFDTAVQLLEVRSAAQREFPELRPGFDARFGKEALLRTESGLELDLHRTFLEGPLGVTIELADLYESPTRFDLAGRALAALPAPQQLIHAAYAAVAGDSVPRLSTLRDVAQIAVELDPDRERVLELAGQWRGRAALAEGLVAAWDVLAPANRPELVEWARSYRASPFERLLLASQRGRARAYTRHAAAVLVVPGVTGRLAYLRAIVWPQPAYLARRGYSRRRFAGRAIDSLREAVRSR